MTRRPRVFHPTPRLVTLCDDLPDAPVWVVNCMAEGWNGFHVPVAPAADFIAYMTACREADTDHPEDWPIPFVDAAGVLRLPAVDAPDDRAADSTWERVSDDAPVYALSGLVWITPHPVYVADGPACPACGRPTIPPTPGTDETGNYCEPCGTAYDTKDCGVSRVR